MMYYSLQIFDNLLVSPCPEAMLARIVLQINYLQDVKESIVSFTTSKQHYICFIYRSSVGCKDDKRAVPFHSERSLDHAGEYCGCSGLLVGVYNIENN